MLHPGDSAGLAEQVDKVSVSGHKGHGKFKTKHGHSAEKSDNGTKFKCDKCKLAKAKCTREKCVTKCFRKVLESVSAEHFKHLVLLAWYLRKVNV